MFFIHTVMVHRIQYKLQIYDFLGKECEYPILRILMMTTTLRKDKFSLTVR
jgi:hypothetical protein